ncbi:hypothetical protein M1397_00245 [Candidatus Marsarchaeota archaeon]|jgi:hypothetical protein|nr:hypothetical protein [Candidatus Marsarchaeota archaeon]
MWLLVAIRGTPETTRALHGSCDLMLRELRKLYSKEREARIVASFALFASLLLVIFAVLALQSYFITYSHFAVFALLAASVAAITVIALKAERIGLSTKSVAALFSTLAISILICMLVA